jgi:hypothetical protein
MSDQSTSTATDVTAVRRNPGLGHVSGRMCIKCDSKHVSQEGWGSIFYAGRKRMVCPRCVAERNARRKA